jgi:hypothetical protein
MSSEATPTEPTCDFHVTCIEQLHQYRIQYVVEYVSGVSTEETFFTLATSESEAIVQLRQHIRS